MGSTAAPGEFNDLFRGSPSKIPWEGIVAPLTKMVSWDQRVDCNGMLSKQWRWTAWVSSVLIGGFAGMMPSAQAEDGTLQIRANGEDFVRQGFVSKDGWQIDFDHIFVNLADVTAYQSDPPFDPEAAEAPEAEISVALEEITTVDLAAGDAEAETILVAELEAPEGRYNALSWRMVEAESGPAEDQVMVMVGTAEQDGETLPFTLQIGQEYAFFCGDFVGDERKGILSAGEMAEIEATFHFDHIFGDGEADADDPINTGALGFQPLADIAEGEELVADLETLEAELSEEDFELLTEALISLGHVGEGHCEETIASR